MADLTRARIEQLLARASEPEYAGTEFTIEDYELRALCSLALVGLAALPEPRKCRKTGDNWNGGFCDCGSLDGVCRPEPKA